MLGLTTKCGRLKTISAAARDCLSPAMFDATHLNRPLSVGNVSKIFKFPVSVTVTLKGNLYHFTFLDKIQALFTKIRRNTSVGMRAFLTRI